MTEPGDHFAGTSARSTKHSPRVDEELEHEIQGMLKAEHATRAEEWREAEPVAEGEPDIDRRPAGTLVGGTPVGMDADAVVARAELARWLDRADFPAPDPSWSRPRATTARPTRSPPSWRGCPRARPTSGSATSSARWATRPRPDRAARGPGARRRPERPPAPPPRRSPPRRGGGTAASRGSPSRSAACPARCRPGRGRRCRRPEGLQDRQDVLVQVGDQLGQPVDQGDQRLDLVRVKLVRQPAHRRREGGQRRLVVAQHRLDPADHALGPAHRRVGAGGRLSRPRRWPRRPCSGRATASMASSALARVRDARDGLVGLGAGAARRPRWPRRPWPGSRATPSIARRPRRGSRRRRRSPRRRGRRSSSTRSSSADDPSRAAPPCARRRADARDEGEGVGDAVAHPSTAARTSDGPGSDGQSHPPHATHGHGGPLSGCVRRSPSQGPPSRASGVMPRAPPPYRRGGATAATGTDDDEKVSTPVGEQPTRDGAGGQRTSPEASPSAPAGPATASRAPRIR